MKISHNSGEKEKENFFQLDILIAAPIYGEVFLS